MGSGDERKADHQSDTGSFLRRGKIVFKQMPAPWRDGQLDHFEIIANTVSADYTTCYGAEKVRRLKEQISDRICKYPYNDITLVI